MEHQFVLEAEGLVKHFQRPRSIFRRAGEAPVVAVNGLSLQLRPKETLALVGESGCGKSTTARMLLDLESPTEGVIRYESVALHQATREQRRLYRSSVQAVFQDPWSSLNPRMRVRQLIAEPLRLNGVSKREAEKAVARALDDVGLEQAAANNFPHEFSGGQRQRIAIARAIAVRPKVIVLDEPVSALDVSVRAQIMNLLKDLQESLGMSYLLISHDLATVRYLANRVAVMLRGNIVEQGDAESVFTNPQHAYTENLISAARIVRPTTTAA
jgi:ABC-type microcin C transport system duplicated ATPase subunit YejF